MYMRTCGSFKSANKNKDWVCYSQIHSVPFLRKVRKSDNSFKSANFADLRFADRPPLLKSDW
jgi:hypothetical protein